MQVNETGRYNPLLQTKPVKKITKVSVVKNIRYIFAAVIDRVRYRMVAPHLIKIGLFHVLFNGEVLEWLKRRAWKVRILQKGIAGSNPALSAKE